MLRGVPQVVSFALGRLQQMPWRRVDVSFAGARMGTAHNNIQVGLRTGKEGEKEVAEERLRNAQTLIPCLVPRLAPG